MHPSDPDSAPFYQRQVAMPEIGPAGQARLSTGSVLVIGAGGLGSPILFALAGAGVGRIGIVDDDRVSVSNLNRQFLFTPADIGRLKAEQARLRLSAYHPDLTIEAFPERLTLSVASERFSQFDVIVGAVDNNRTRRIINAVCCQLKKTWIDGGVRGLSGYTAQIDPGKTPCFDCLFGFSGLRLPDDADPILASPEKPTDRTASIGVLGATAGVIGSMEASLAVLSLLGLPSPLQGEIFYYSGKQMTTNRIRVERTPDCPVCSKLF